MTKNWIYSSLTEVISDAILSGYLLRGVLEKKFARLSYEMAQFVLKIAHLAISIEPTLLLEKVLVAVSFPDYGPWEYS